MILCFLQILCPLADRVKSLIGSLNTQTSGAVDNELLNVFDCITGVAEAVQLFSANVLFGWSGLIWLFDYLVRKMFIKQWPMFIKNNEVLIRLGLNSIKLS